MNVLFAPDYRVGNPYQARLAAALEVAGDCTVNFANGYRRGLPLTRLVRTARPDLLHLHWPEAYCPQFGIAGPLRPWRLPLDLWLSNRICPYVITAHNLWPHHHPRGQASMTTALDYAYRHARVIIAHSTVAAELVARHWQLSDDRICVIPHGNLADAFDPTALRAAAPEPPCALNFGTITPYKGIEDLIRWWRHERPGLPLKIMGIVNDPDYAESLRHLIAGDAIIRFQPDKVSDEELATQVATATVVVMNHETGLTSGVASLARSLGARILLPRRLAAVDLLEPHPSVFRFDALEADFKDQLESAMNSPRPPAVDPVWWKTTAWNAVATATLNCYQQALAS